MQHDNEGFLDDSLSDAAVYVISVAAELAGMHPQTLRQYDRLGLVCPRRTSGCCRRYSANDIAQLRLIQKLSQEDGINLAGIAQILQLQRENRRLRQQNRQLKKTLVQAQHLIEAVKQRQTRAFTATASGDISSYRTGVGRDVRGRSNGSIDKTGANQRDLDQRDIDSAEVESAGHTLILYRQNRQTNALVHLAEIERQIDMQIW